LEAPEAWAAPANVATAIVAMMSVFMAVSLDKPLYFMAGEITPPEAVLKLIPGHEVHYVN
jgi:hypothetical protein